MQSPVQCTSRAPKNAAYVTLMFIPTSRKDQNPNLYGLFCAGIMHLFNNDSYLGCGTGNIDRIVDVPHKAQKTEGWMLNESVQIPKAPCGDGKC